jgi:hypothetical protein
LISNIKGGTWTEGASEQGAEENIGPKRDEVIEGWRKLRNKEFHNLYSSPSIIRMEEAKDDEMGRVCSTNGAKWNAYRIFVGKPEKRDHWEDQDVSGWIILKWILDSKNGVIWTELIWLRTGIRGGLLRI